jgi:beta-phosphoglucomutase-like phosphatase (HAD superfamily)
MERAVTGAEHAGFIFDMDGVLTDSMPFHMDAWMEVLAEHGIRKSRAEVLRDIGGTTNLRILHQWFGRELSEADIAGFEERKETLYRRLYRSALRPISGVLEFLGEARRLGIPMAVATAAGSGNREFVLGGLGIQSFFGAVVGPEDVLEGKPDPAMFLRAAEKLALAS